MSEFRDLLDQERRRHRMSDGSFRDLERRRDRKRRNRRLGSGVLALVIAAAGIGAGLYAFRPTGSAQPANSPTPSTGPSTPTPSPSHTIEPPPAAAALVAPSGPLQFLDDQHGWAVINGQLMSTTDGGTTWTPSDLGSNVEGVDFVDLQHGWAVGPSGVLQTVDGGTSWEVVSDQVFTMIDFVDAQTGWAVRPESYAPAPKMLVKTEDGGRTWADQLIQTDSVCASDSQHVWSAGGGGDGGMSVFQWSGGTAREIQLQIPAGEPWQASIRCAADGTQAFVLLTGGGAAGHVAYAAFQVTPDSQRREVHPVLVASFAAGELGLDTYQDDDPYPGVFTAGEAGRAYFVNWCPACDGSWASFVKAEGQPSEVTDRVAIPTSQHPRAPVGISFVSPDRGWILFGSPELLLTTEDAGKTWSGPCDNCFPPVSVP
jgi:Photosynthesis system II assembly factor YCF48